jgi:hypothetical protein
VTSRQVLNSFLRLSPWYFPAFGMPCMSDYRRGLGLEIGFIDQFNTWLVTTLNYSAIADLYTSQITTAHAKSFPACRVFTSRSLVTAYNSGDSSTTPTKSCLHQLNYNSLSTKLAKVKDKVTFLMTVSQSVSLGVEPHLGIMTRYLLVVDSYGLVFLGRSLCQEDGSVFCMCCWPSPA